MLTVAIIKSFKNDNDILKWLEKVRIEDENFYYFIIDNFKVLPLIKILKEGKKYYSSSGTIIEMVGDRFKLTNLFDRDYIKFTDSIFNNN